MAPSDENSWRRVFTAGDVQRLVGLTQRQLTYWDQSAVVRPHGRPAQGRGSRRLYTLLDVLQLKLIRRLREAGMSLQKIRRALRYLADLPDEPAPLAELEVLTDGRRILVRRSDEQLLDLLAQQLVLRLSLADLLTEVRDDIGPPPLRDARGERTVGLLHANGDLGRRFRVGQDAADRTLRGGGYLP